MKYLILALSLLYSTAGFAAPTLYPDIKNFTVLNVYDGDTFHIDIYGYPPLIGTNIAVRIRGVDTPELNHRRCATSNTSQACIAKRFTKQALELAKTIELKNIQRDKYFRIDAEVYVDGHNLADLLITAGLGKTYDGGAKDPWGSTGFTDIQQRVLL